MYYKVQLSQFKVVYIKLKVHIEHVYIHQYIQCETIKIKLHLKKQLDMTLHVYISVMGPSCLDMALTGCCSHSLPSYSGSEWTSGGAKFHWKWHSQPAMKWDVCSKWRSLLLWLLHKYCNSLCKNIICCAGRCIHVNITYTYSKKLISQWYTELILTILP